MKIYQIKDKIRRCWLQFKMLVIRDGWKKAEYIKKKKIFHYIGEKVYYDSNLLPAEPFLVCLHDNVVISAGVRIITHSVAHTVFNHEDNMNDYLCRYGKVEIHDNVYVGAGAIINFGVTINSNCIIGAGAVVTHDVPSGSVVGGVPAKIIGSYEDVKQRHLQYSNSFENITDRRWVIDLVKQQPVKFDIDEENNI